MTINLTPELLAEPSAANGLLVLLGADSELGMAVARADRSAAEAELARWGGALPTGSLALAATDHLVGGQGAGSTRQAARLVAPALGHRRADLAQPDEPQVRAAHAGRSHRPTGTSAIG